MFCASLVQCICVSVCWSLSVCPLLLSSPHSQTNGILYMYSCSMNNRMNPTRIITEQCISIFFFTRKNLAFRQRSTACKITCVKCVCVCVCALDHRKLTRSLSPLSSPSFLYPIFLHHIRHSVFLVTSPLCLLFF